MSHHQIFPDIYFRYQLAQHDEVKQKLLNKYDPADSEEDANWNCNSTRVYVRPEEVLPDLLPALREFGDEIKKPVRVNLEATWINFYQSGGFQEIHNHVGGGCQLAMVYFVSYDPRNDGRFYFYDTNTEIVATDLPVLLNGPLGKFGSVSYPDISEGDVLIFPSYLHHGVSPYKGSELRVTLSCNLTFKMRRPQKKPT